MVGPEGYDPLYDDLDPIIRYYDWDGKQITLRQSLEMRSAPGYDPHVGSDYIDPEKKIWVSTVHLPMDHRLGREGPPLIFETMVFDQRENCTRPWHDLVCDRYSTREQAEAGHRGTVEEFTVLYNALEGVSVQGNAEEPVGHVGEGTADDQPSVQPHATDE